MIYFDKKTQIGLLERFAPLLNPGGLLFVGHSENFSQARNLFHLLGKTVYEVQPEAANKLAGRPATPDELSCPRESCHREVRKRPAAVAENGPKIYFDPQFGLDAAKSCPASTTPPGARW